MSTTDPRRDARDGIRQARMQDRQQASLARLIQDTTELTGKQVTKIVVHYADKTSQTVRPEGTEERRTRRRDAVDGLKRAGRERGHA